MSHAINLLKNELSLLENQKKLCTGKEVTYKMTVERIESLKTILNKLENK